MSDQQTPASGQRPTPAHLAIAEALLYSDVIPNVTPSEQIRALVNRVLLGLRERCTVAERMEAMGMRPHTLSNGPSWEEAR